MNKKLIFLDFIALMGALIIAGCIGRNDGSGKAGDTKEVVDSGEKDEIG
jgi:hypothetical protein